MGEMNEWQKWKSRTEYAFNGSGYKRVFIYATWAAWNTHMNQVVYSQLTVVTILGTAHHLIKKDENNKNGYGAWNALSECYDGGAVKN